MSVGSGVDTVVGSGVDVSAGSEVVTAIGSGVNVGTDVAATVGLGVDSAEVDLLDAPHPVRQNVSVSVNRAICFFILLLLLT